MAEIPELDSTSGCESLESERNMGTQKISVSDNTIEKSDSFVIDMDAFSSGVINKDSNSNSRITLQRSVSRKGWSDKKVNVPTAALRDWDTIPTACTPSPKDVVVGCGTQEKLGVPAVGSGDHCSSPQIHHQITITATTINEAKSIARRNSFKRSSTWGLDPKRILLLFATLSSMGSILLIYLTLSISNEQNGDESRVDWKQ